MSLEQYASERPRLRSEVIAHKQLRNVQVGPNMTWCFEDRTTIRYQILEMLRAERIFEGEGIQAELDAYNPLIPDGSNWKVTLLLEFPDPRERRVALEKLDRRRRSLLGASQRNAAGICDRRRRFRARKRRENLSGAFPALRAVGDDGRSHERQRLLSIGVDHEQYRHSRSPLPAAIRDALGRDLA